MSNYCNILNVLSMGNCCRILSLVQQWLPIRLQLPLTPRPEIRWLTMKWVFFFSKSHLFLHHAFSFCLGENCVRTIFGLKCKMCSLGGNRSFGWKICKVERVQGWPEGQHHWHQRRWYEGEHLHLQSIIKHWMTFLSRATPSIGWRKPWPRSKPQDPRARGQR